MVHNILGSVDILGVLRFIYEDWRRGRGRRVEGVRVWVGGDGWGGRGRGGLRVWGGGGVGVCTSAILVRY